MLKKKLIRTCLSDTGASLKQDMTLKDQNDKVYLTQKERNKEGREKGKILLQNTN